MTTPNDLPSVGTEDARAAFEHRMLYFGWRNFTGEVMGTPPCWYYANSDLNARWVGWREACNMLRTLASERDQRAARVRELESEVLEQCRLNGMGAERELALMGRVRELEGAMKPNLFWNDADPEHGETSIFEVIDSEWNGGCMKHGDEMVIQQAVRLPNIRVRLIPCPTDGDDYFDFEVVDAALTASKGQP